LLGGAGLALGIAAARAEAQASAPPPFTNANYANRYVCNVTAGGNQAVAIMKINPNGKGRYTAGTFLTPISPFAMFDPTATPPSNFCSYSLDTSTSTYAIDSHGSGSEVLTWAPATSNNAACPPGLVFNTRTELRNSVNGNNVVARTLFTLGVQVGPGALSAPGDGYCLK